MRVVGLILVASWCAGCPSSSPACARNSECSLGHFCAEGRCEQECTPATEEDDCGAGGRCNSFGMCVGSDAGVADAGSGDVGAIDAGSLDAPACTDEDEDGTCVDVDCDDTDPTAHPGASEICTPSTAGSTPKDENCDGAIDEGCGWYFGRPHVVPALVMPRASGYVDTSGAWVSSDGLRIYTSYHQGGLSNPALFVASRASRDVPFAAPEPVAVTGSWSGYELTLTQDELSGVYQCNATGAFTLHTMTRPTRDAPFEVAPLTAFSTGTELHPTLRRDGLELVFVSGGVLHHALRDDVSAPFLSSEPLTGIVGDGPGGPSLSPDGRTLFYYASGDDGRALYSATRSEAGAGDFVDAALLSGLVTGSSDVVLPSFSEPTRELFYLAGGAPDGPLTYTHFRVQVCRDGPCDEPEIDCAAGSVRSADGFHCYGRTAAPQTYAAATTACEALGGHVVEVQSRAEQDLVWGAFSGSNLWMALEQTAVAEVFEWASGAPLAFTYWHASEPNVGASEACAMLTQDSGYVGRWADVNCAAPLHAVCETEVWPTW